MTNLSPDLSVVIINWNTCAMLQEVLQSVFTTTGASIALQVIVVDNDSQDGSADMVARVFPDVLLIRNNSNRGFAAANNQGFRQARGRHILLLNSDTIVRGDVLAASVRYLDDPHHQHIGAMGCRVLNTDGTMQPTCSMYPSLLNLFLLTSGLWKLSWPTFFGRYQMKTWLRDTEHAVEVISGCYLMVRKEILDEVGYLDEAFFFFGEETDWCYRMRQKGWALHFAPVGVIIHHGSVSAQKLNYRRDLLLTNALVRLHHKHGNCLSAATAWMILLIFNTSRAMFWTFVGIFKQRARSRAVHFRAVVRGQIKKEA